jgi:hypothetical protein
LRSQTSRLGREQQLRRLEFPVADAISFRGSLNTECVARGEV